MDLIVPNFPEVTQLAIPAFVALILVELFFIRRLKDSAGFETRDTATSLMMGVGNVVSGLIFGFVAYGVLTWAYDYRLFTIGFEWYWVLVCFVIDDLRYYWYHRIAHRCRWVWAEHVIHHSSQHYNLSTALRQSWTGVFTGMFVLRIPLVLINRTSRGGHESVFQRSVAVIGLIHDKEIFLFMIFRKSLAEYEHRRAAVTSDISLSSRGQRDRTGAQLADVLPAKVTFLE